MVGTRARHELASQDGFALMEVIISAAVLVVVVLGVLAGLDAVTGTAGANKARTVAATLAEKDQERMRGMRIPDIDAMNTLPYDVKVGTVTYHVESNAAWINDDSGQEVSCGLSKTQASYMRITSTVTSPMTGAKVKPVVLSSLVAPQVGAAASGSLAVLVKGAAGQPVPGVSVSAAGPKVPLPETTNALGCAVFGDLTAGTYAVTLNKVGYVDKEGVTTPSNDVTVTAGSMSTQEFAYDLAASITLNVKNLPAGSAEPAKNVVAGNGQLGGGLRTFGPTTASQVAGLADPIASLGVTYPSGTVFSLTNLFPFTDGYTFYSGGCTANDPSKAIPDTNYFTTYGGKVTLAPGQNGGTINVYEPTVNIFVRRGSSGSTALSGATVWAYPTNTGCTQSRIKLGTSDGLGKLQYNGLPFGTFTLCAQSGSRRGLTNVNVNSTVGIPTQTTISAVTNSPALVCGDTAPDSTP